MEKHDMDRLITAAFAAAAAAIGQGVQPFGARPSEVVVFAPNSLLMASNGEAARTWRFAYAHKWPASPSGLVNVLNRPN